MELCNSKKCDQKNFFHVCVCVCLIFATSICICECACDSSKCLIHKIQLKLSKHTIVNGDVSFLLLLLLFLCVSPFIFVSFKNIPHNLCAFNMWLTHLLLLLLFFNCLTFKFSTVQIVLCTHNALARCQLLYAFFFHSI